MSRDKSPAHPNPRRGEEGRLRTYFDAPGLVQLLRENRIDPDSKLYGDALKAYGDLRHGVRVESIRAEFTRRMQRARRRQFHLTTAAVVVRSLFHLAWMAALVRLILSLSGQG